MPGHDFRIRPAWPDFMVYEEGEGRSIPFDCRSLDEPPQVSVPAARRWNARMPEWAQDARARIVGRLRESGCIVFEEDDELTTALSPDGTVRIALPDRPVLRRIVAWVCALGSLVLAAGGAWMVFAGASLKDRGIGALGVLFFGACAASFLGDRPRRRSALDSSQEARQ